MNQKGVRKVNPKSTYQLTVQPAREAPAPKPLHCGLTDPSHPAVPEEPVLNIDNIQGNILDGFNKDHQAFLFLKIANLASFRRWLKSLVPFIATSAEVVAFNRLFKAIRAKRGESTVKATWINVAFSYPALVRLRKDATLFTDEAFKQGLAARSKDLGDPVGRQAEGDPRNWVIGGPKKEADLVVIVASDDRNDLRSEAKRIKNSLKGARIIFEQEGATLPPPLTGHEHFGFLDGVSQPGLRGRLSNDPHDVLTLRRNPKNRNQGKPGQDVLWPGEFVFGYPGQDPNKEIEKPGPVSVAGPEWARDGSFLVVRRLRQDVFSLHDFLRKQGRQLKIAPNLVGAKLVGRWRSGAPILRATDKDNPALADDECANNHFEFQEDGEPILNSDRQSDFDCADEKFPPSREDKEGAVCPFAAHIRKAYPRDDVSLDPDNKLPNESDTQTHRIIRRGIPFGRASRSTPDAPIRDAADRGLVFLAYQTSIAEQFEFVLTRWANNPDFKEPLDLNKKSGAGHDMIIGQNGKAGENRERRFILTAKTADGNERREVLTTRTDWVIPTGGGYFFAPSIDALNLLST